MTALDRAISLADGVAGLASRLGVRPQNVNNWRKRGVPATQCVRVADAVGQAVTAHDLRPDVFPLAGEQGTPGAAARVPEQEGEGDPDEGRYGSFD